ncbi:MAG: dynamin family protein [Cyanobacteria bacterium P01_H01_bin.35]
MPENSLRARAEEIFESAIKLTADSSNLAGLHQEIQQCHQRLHEPMRVAVVGKIKAGKSSLMNALLGESVVATGVEELTFNVNWFKYGETPSLVVHFKIDRPPETKTLEELELLTRRREENRSFLVGIEYIEVFHPNQILKTFNLIDTPGLDSAFSEDSSNTLDFMQLHPEDLTGVTQKEASKADAILYLFSQSMATSDQGVLEEFIGEKVENSTPINSIGVLTKVDNYWPDKSDPLDTGKAIAQRLLSEHSQLRNLLYTIFPVSGLLGLGAKTLLPEDFATLEQLAALPIEEFESLTKSAKRFNKEYSERPNIPPSINRKKLFDKLKLYGIFKGCELIRGGIKNNEELKDKLLGLSGLPELEKLVVSHFGNRAFLIKLNSGLKKILVACRQYKQKNLSERDAEILEKIAIIFEELEVKEHSFKELQVLRDYYDGKLDFNSNEVKQLLEVTGEYGTYSGYRLGLDDTATIPEMLNIAQERINSWYQKAEDVMDKNRQTINATRIMARSYEQILYHLKEAEKHLW